MAELVLASSSPRRRALLDTLGVAYRSVAPDVDEPAVAGGAAPPDAVLAVALAKARAVRSSIGRGGTVLAADTVVVCEDVVMGQPADRADARRMLEHQSGRSIEVLSGVALLDGGAEPRTALVTSTVHLRPLDRAEIDAYLATGAADDKAGALEVQGAAAGFVTGVDGSYTNVLGLPLEVVATWLVELGFTVEQPGARTV